MITQATVLNAKPNQRRESHLLAPEMGGSEEAPNKLWESGW